MANPADRGTHYADGGTAWGTICWPDPARIAQIHTEWEPTSPQRDKASNE